MRPTDNSKLKKRASRILLIMQIALAFLKLFNGDGGHVFSPDVVDYIDNFMRVLRVIFTYKPQKRKE